MKSLAKSNSKIFEKLNPFKLSKKPPTQKHQIYTETKKTKNPQKKERDKEIKLPQKAKEVERRSEEGIETSDRRKTYSYYTMKIRIQKLKIHNTILLCISSTPSSYKQQKSILSDFLL